MHISRTLWLALCAPFASGLAAEPASPDPSTQDSDPSSIADDARAGKAAPAVSGSTDAATGVIRYPASFFTEFQPSTALDMVKRLPGFNFNKGDTEVRGYAGALGNVLIDGQRPTSKSVLLEDVLRRIPVSGVAAIEVIRGGAPGINMQGQSVLANVVRISGNFSTHAAEVTGMFATEHDPSVQVRLETTHNLNRLALTGAFNYKDEQQYGSTGRGSQIRQDMNGALLEYSDFEADWTQNQLQANGSAEYQTDSGLLRFNLGGTRQDSRQLDMLRPRSGVLQTSEGQVLSNIRQDQGEAGIDYEHQFNSVLSGRQLLLQTLEKKTITADAANALLFQNSEDEARRGESILRSSLTYTASPALTIEGGLEGAYNFLDVDASLRRNGLNVPLPAAKVKVEERRGETYVDARWKISPRLASDLGIRYEVSTISQSGDSNAKRTLRYPKPRALLTFNVNEGLQLRGRIERTVGQLEFRDFASQASLDAGTINGGNANLRPETAWEFEGAIEKRFWGSGSAMLGYTHSLVSNVIDWVPAGNFDTVGNIGDGVRGKISMSLSLPLEHIGLERTLLRINSNWTWSEVDDPITGAQRRISKHSPFEGDILLTREFPSLSSTLTLESFGSNRQTSYRLGEVRTDHWDHYPSLYWDWQPRADTSVRLTFNNFTGRPRSRWRTVYEGGTRASGVPTYFEDRHFGAMRSIQLRVRRTF